MSSYRDELDRAIETAIDPATSLDLNATEPELATAVTKLREIERELADLRRAAERELISRMEENGARVMLLPDGRTLTLRSGRSRVWDPDELETVARDLAERGIIQPAQYTGLLRREIRVDGTIAARLLSQLSGDPRRDVSACFEWKPGRPTLEITAPTGDEIVDGTIADLPPPA